MKKPRPVWPKESSGKSALWIGLLGLSSWIILPLITTLFRTTFPITDTYVMPVIGSVMIVGAALWNLITYVFLRQRSAMNVVMLSLTVFWAAFTTLFVVGEGIAGI